MKDKLIYDAPTVNVFAVRAQNVLCGSNRAGVNVQYEEEDWA